MPRVKLLAKDEILFTEEPHEYAVLGQKLASVTEVIRTSGLGDDFSAVPEDRMEFAQRRGRMVHMAIEYMNSKKGLNMKSVDERIRGYVLAYMHFMMDCPIKIVASEKRLAAMSIKVAGTADLICFLRGFRCVIDFKTGQNQSQSAHLQTAGYSILWNESFPAKAIQKRYGLRLEWSGKYKLIPHEDAHDYSAFISAAEYHRAVEKNKTWRNYYGIANHHGT